MKAIGDGMAWLQHNKRLASICAALLVAALGLAALFRLLHSVRPHEVRHAFGALSAGQISAAMLLTTASYLMLTLYDRFALQVIGRKLPWRTYALASFTSYCLLYTSRCV